MMLHNTDTPTLTTRFKAHTTIAVFCLFLLFAGGSAPAAELSVDDFDFNGILGSDGARLERLGPNHFKIHLAEAPGHRNRFNMCQLVIKQNARGNTLRLDGIAKGVRQFCSWSYDSQTWHPILPEKITENGKTFRTFIFPAFEQDQVYVGGEIPMPYGKLVELRQKWAKHPHATLHNIGKSLEDRTICRLTITDPDSPVALPQRWGHHVVNQHCYEYNAMWRIAGMIDWLLSDEGSQARQRNVWHFVVQMNVDGPHNGWGRINRQGIDLNRAYSVSGWKNNPAHESQVVQRDLEQLANSQTALTTTWSMHTWSGERIEPMLRPGPEMGKLVGPWTELRDTLKRNDTKNQSKPLRALTSKTNPTHWCSGTYLQLKVSAFCVEGAAENFTRQGNMETGALLIKSISEFYGQKPKLHAAITSECRRGGHLRRYKAMNEKLKEGNVDLLFIGDSITAGFPGRGKETWEKYYAHRNVVNMGRSGERTQHILWQLDNLNVDNISPKLAVMLIGTNNVYKSNGVEIAEGITKIVDRLHARLPKTKLLLMAILPRGATKENPHRLTIEETNRIIAKLGDDEMVTYMDIGKHLIKPDGTPTRLLRSDNLHISPAGYRVWAEAIEPMVARELGPRHGDCPTSIAEIVAPFEMPQLQRPHFPDRTFDIRDYGAKGDGETKNTKAFSKAIEACAISGGGKVLVPEGTWLTGPIHLKSNVNLHFEKGAELHFSTDPKDYLPVVFTRWEGFELYNYSPLIYAIDCENIAVTGPGKLFGHGKAWWGWKGLGNRTARRHIYPNLILKGIKPEERIFGTPEAGLRPQFISPTRCKNVLFEGFTIATPGPFWTFDILYCENIIVRDLRIYTVGGPNTDGINISSSRNALIEYCVLETGDDCITMKSGLNEEGWRIGRPTENVVIRHIKCLFSAGGGITIGSEMSGGVRNLLAHDCEFQGAYTGIRLKSNNGRGGTVENIWCRNLKMSELRGYAFNVDLNYGTFKAGKKKPTWPLFRNIIIENLVCDGAKAGAMVVGQSEKPFVNFTLKDVSIKANEGMKFTWIEGLTLKNVQCEPVQGEPIIIEHCKNVVQSSEPGNEAK
jgi:polygalacturonase/lysophospholipase L1-like esterase